MAVSSVGVNYANLVHKEEVVHDFITPCVVGTLYTTPVEVEPAVYNAGFQDRY